MASSMPPSQRGAFPPTMPPRFMPPAQNGMPMRGSMPQFTGGYPQQQQQQQGQLQQQQQQQQGQLQQHAYNPSSLYDSGAGAGASAMYQPGAMLTCFLVQFTSGRTDTYYIPHESHLSVTIGDYVVVEADRGQDLGRVFMDNISVPLPRRNSTTAVVGGSGTSGSSVGGVGGFGPGNDGYAPTFDMDDQQQYNGGNSPVPSNFPKRIYRLAQPVEIESLLAKVRDEINAIAVGQYKVQEWKLPMVIIDAEYQWYVVVVGAGCL